MKKSLTPKKNIKLSLRLYLTFLMLALLVVVYVIATLAVSLLRETLYLNNLLSVVLFGAAICLVVGSVSSFFLSKAVLYQVSKLKKAMGQVAHGDFTVQLKTKNRLEEVQDLYSDFNHMVRGLASTETIQTDFISNVSHEFKTPINAIEGYTTLLQGEANLTDEQKEYVEKILYNTRRLLHLTSSILLLSKINNQVLPAKMEAFRLDEQIRQAIVALEEKWTAKEIALDVEMEEITFVGNETTLFHVWLNLMDNAVKFDPPGGKLIVRLFSRADAVCFTVQDSGPGLAETERERIFEKFYQQDTSHKDEGNGLGLALVKRILDLHGGSITPENCPEGGCRFTVLLPLPVG